MTTSAQGRVLRHGTTRKRAEAILKNGPDPNFKEPGGLDTAGGFSTFPVGDPVTVGLPEVYAAGKAALFPDEGGPAILEVEVPPEIVSQTDPVGGEVRFEPGSGLEDLLKAWSGLPRRIL